MNEKRRTELHRDHIGFVFQSYHLIDELTVFENLYLATRGTTRRRFGLLRPGRDDGSWHDTERLLDAVGLDASRNTKVSELAHGQQRQLEIGMALASKDIERAEALKAEVAEIKSFIQSGEDTEREPGPHRPGP